MSQSGKILYSRTGHKCQYGVCALHAEYLRLQTHIARIRNTAFPLQQWLHQRASKLRFKYTACLVYAIISNGDVTRCFPSGLTSNPNTSKKNVAFSVYLKGIYAQRVAIFDLRHRLWVQ
jgi:hypothetical protein